MLTELVSVLSQAGEASQRQFPLFLRFYKAVSLIIRASSEARLVRSQNKSLVFVNLTPVLKHGSNQINVNIIRIIATLETIKL